MPVTVQIRDSIAIISIENPPVNSLDHPTRRALFHAFEVARADPRVVGVVLGGSERTFSAGADIREFGTPRADCPPTLHALIEQLESMEKPVVVALGGSALGGGLELALAAHYRVALRGASLGLPEVKLGLLPGAGGTQRLPRAVGLPKALELIVSGEPARANELAGTALLDRIVEGGAAGDLLAAAVELATQAAQRGGPLPLLRHRSVQRGDAEGILSRARRAAASAEERCPAPLACVDALQAAVDRPFEEGLRIEREAFGALVRGDVSRAIRHAFFAERAARKLPDVGPEVRPRPVRTVAVIGAGTMGGGIAMSFASAGIDVTLLDTSRVALDRCLRTARQAYGRGVQKGKLTPEQAEQRMSRIRPALDYDAVRSAELVVEAAFEEYAVKEAIFRQLDAVARPGAILATNTSTLDVDRLAAVTSRPGDVVGLHFFSPAHVMKLLEVVRGERTERDVLATAMALAKVLGKTAVVARVCDGFIGNRMLHRYLRQASLLLDEGALPQQVDGAMERFGFAMGPFRVGDLAGNDIGWAIRKRRYVEFPSEATPPNAADRLCECGRFGQKTGKGWYDYRPGDRTAHPSAAVEALLARHAAELGVPRRELTDREIVERLVYSLVDEGARLLEEGIAARASDIDLVYLTGYGFPAFRGGPMFYADSVGLTAVLWAMRRFSRGYRGDLWEPAPLLERLEEAGEPLTG